MSRLWSENSNINNKTVIRKGSIGICESFFGSNNSSSIDIVSVGDSVGVVRLVDSFDMFFVLDSVNMVCVADSELSKILR